MRRIVRAARPSPSKTLQAAATNGQESRHAMARWGSMLSQRPSTLTQVAERAGVSLTTASKVINNTGRISEQTRARVLAAARELRFVPNPHARSLHTGRTSIVGA